MPLPLIVKVTCSLMMVVSIVLALPNVTSLWVERTKHLFAQTTTIQERVARNEAQISSQEHRQDSTDIRITAVDNRLNGIAERLASIESRQSLVLALLGPIAVFMVTHTWEKVTEWREKRK